MNLAAIWSVMKMELSVDRRFVRFWIFVAIATVFSLVSLIGNFGNYWQFSAFSSSALFYSPLMLPFSVFPSLLLILSLGVIFLGIDFLSRDRRDRIEEVFTTLPITNIELAIGKALGLSLILFIPFILFIFIYYATGLILEVAMPELGFGPPVLAVTLAAILLDAIPNFLFWAALVIFLTVLLRYRAIVLVLAIGILVLVTWAQNSAPLYVSSMLSIMSVGLIFPSELTPQFTNSTIVVQRIAVLLFSFGLLYWSSLLMRRQDGSNRGITAGLAGALSVLTALSFVFVYQLFHSDVERADRYLLVHEQETVEQDLNVQSMNGMIEVDPGGDLDINLTLAITNEANVPDDGNLVFSLNPGYEIESLEIDGRQVEYRFNDGYLSVDPGGPIAPATTFELEIRATGENDPVFAYFDSAVNPYKSDAYGVAGMLFLGNEASINDSDYVALTPDVAWYPRPGSHSQRDLKHIHPSDFFDLDLIVVIPEDWYIAGPGTPEIESRSNARIVRFAPPNPVHEVALFAAEFDRRTLRISDIDFELLVSPKHTRNIDKFASSQTRLMNAVTERIEQSRAMGLDYPFETFTIVEVPIQYRTYRGGWRMDSAQTFPGVFTLREGTFLSALFDPSLDALRENEELTEEEKEEREFALLMGFFNNDISGGNVLVAAASNFLRFQTDAVGPGAIPLSYVLNYLANTLISEAENFYSIHILKEAQSFGTAAIGMAMLRNTDVDRTLSDMFYEQHINQPNVWDAMFNSPFGMVDYANLDSSEDNLHVLHLRGREMARLLRDWLGRENAFQLLAELRSRYKGENFSYEDLATLAGELGTPVDEVFDDWLDEVTLPGFRTSAVDIVRLPDLEYGVPLYESTFFVENSEPSPGMITIEYQADEPQTEGEAAIDLRPIKLPGNSAVEVALHTQDPIEHVRIIPYFSLNRAPFNLQINTRREYPEVESEPKPFVTVSDWRYDESGSILLDDLDEGFSVDEPSEPQVPGFVTGLMSFALPQPAMDQGLPSFSVFSFGSWSRQVTDSSYGRYRRTMARAQSGSGLKAHFDVSIPTAGRWRLEYHLPQPSILRFASGAFQPMAGATVRVNAGSSRRRARFSDFTLFIENNEESTRFDVEGSEMRAGWNRISEFDLAAGDVRVSASTIGASGPVAADAIRWTEVN